VFCKRHFATAFYTPRPVLLLLRGIRKEYVIVHSLQSAGKVFSFQTTAQFESKCGVLTIIITPQYNIKCRRDSRTIKYVVRFLNSFRYSVGYE